MPELSHGTHLTLSVLRGLACGREPCPVMMREFAQCCGAEAPETISMLRAFLLAAAGAARRRVTVAPLGWQDLTAGEQQMLSLIHAAQCDDESALDAQVRWFARLETQATVRSAARNIAATLAVYGLRVSDVTPVEHETAHDRLMFA